MKVTMQNFQGKKYLVVKTGMMVADYRKDVTTNTLKDEDGFVTLCVEFAVGATGKITFDHVVVNGIEAGEYTVVIPVPDSCKLEDIKKMYGAALVEVSPKFAALIEQMKKEATDIDAMFAECVEDAETAQVIESAEATEAE